MLRDAIDIDLLLAPISDDKPVGEDIRWEPVWGELNQLRKTIKDPLDSNKDRDPEWQEIIEETTELLLRKTKDLRIASWLAEALAHEDGFRGFRDGLRLLRQLSERYWEQIYPLLEGDDASVRAAPFAFIADANGGARLGATFRLVPIAKSTTEEILNWNYRNSRTIPPQGREEPEDEFVQRQRTADERRTTFDEALEATPVSFYVERAEEVSGCLQEIGSLEQLLDAKMHDVAPGWSDLRKSLTEIQVFLTGVVARRGGGTTAGPAASEEGAAMINGAAGMSTGPIHSRGEAVARLEEVARFFSAMDPHSPVAYLVRRAIRWANMSFEELIAELVKDDVTLQHIGDTLGIQPHRAE